MCSQARTDVARQGVGDPHVTRFFTGWPERRAVPIDIIDIKIMLCYYIDVIMLYKR
jgi:hypothetical protein